MILRAALSLVLLALLANRLGAGETDVDFSLSAKEFAAECKQDPAAANKKYLGQRVELRGTISQLGRNLYDESFVHLDGLPCLSQTAEPWADFAPGQQVTLTGVCIKGVFGPVVKGTLTAIDKNPAIVGTARDIAALFAEDNAAARESYHDKYFVVRGTIDRIEFNDAGAAAVLLNTGDALPVGCTFDFSHEKALRKLKPGQRFAAFGQFHRILSDRDKIELFFCQRITTRGK